MASTPKNRTKSHHTNPKPNSTSNSSHIFPVEPSRDFFPSKSEFFKLLAVVAIASFVAIACNFIVNELNRPPKPFCDSNVEFDDSLSDICEPCPSNGICHEGKLECATGYRNLGKSCIEDGDINEIAKKLSRLVEIHVCEAYARYLCNGNGKFWTQEDDLWNNLNEFNLIEHYGLETAVYVHAKQRAMRALDELLETRTNSSGIKELKCPDMLVKHYKPVTCYIRQWIAEHALVLVPVCALLLGSTYIFVRVRRRHYLSVRAEQLYNKVCDILEENALVSRSVTGEGEPWVVASWLRDHLLSPRERRDPLLWKKVEELVQEDSRLDRYPKMVKGESKVVWEWQVEGSLSSSGKRKKAEEIKFKPSEGTTLASGYTRWTPKAGDPLHF